MPPRDSGFLHCRGSAAAKVAGGHRSDQAEERFNEANETTDRLI